VYIPVSELRELCTQSLAALGYSAEEIKTLCEVRSPMEPSFAGEWACRRLLRAAAAAAAAAACCGSAAAAVRRCSALPGDPSGVPILPHCCGPPWPLSPPAHYAHAHTRPQVLLYAQLRGNNQGVIKITTGGMNRAPTAGRMAVEKETRLSALLNGNGEAGMLVLSRAMDMAVAKAKEHGFGVVGTHHTATSTGALGYYAEKVCSSCPV
jgi:hypothetical protein